MPPTTTNQYAIHETPLFSPRPLRIITIGAGASGINMIRTLRQTLGTLPYSHVVYEKNPDVGGTWFENRYPGCRCDVPSHNYQFSWRKNPEWTNFFASAGEIHGYLRRICEEEEMWGEIRTGCRVKGVRWHEERAKWEVRVEKGDGGEVVDLGDFLIDASGILK